MSFVVLKPSKRREASTSLSPPPPPPHSKRTFAKDKTHMAQLALDKSMTRRTSKVVAHQPTRFRRIRMIRLNTSLSNYIKANAHTDNKRLTPWSSLRCYSCVGDSKLLWPWADLQRAKPVRMRISRCHGNIRMRTVIMWSWRRFTDQQQLALPVLTWSTKLGCGALGWSFLKWVFASANQSGYLQFASVCNRWW